jgi:site-specific DNA recombinase
MMTQIAALYARVSTQQQEQEATIDSQVAAVEAFAQAQGYILSKELYFLDEAVSGAKLDRPALDHLRDLVAEGLFQVVLCLSPDRLARQYAHQWVLLNEFQRAGVQVVFINQPPVENNPQSQLFFGIQGLFSEYERAMITERLRRGKLYRVRQGQLVNPVAPYGYRYIPVSEPGGGRWEIDPREAPVVCQIYQWYTKDNGTTIWQIVERLNTQGDQAPPRAKRWQYSTVQAILTQSGYTGQAYYNRTQVCHDGVGRPKLQGRGKKQHSKQVPRPREEWIPVSVPAILTQDMWQCAQERLAMKQKFAVRNSKKRFYLLRSLLVCGVCGHTLVGRTSSNGRKTYACPYGDKLRNPDIPSHGCIISAETIEPIVWQAVCDLLRNPRLMADAWNNQADALPATPGETDRLKNRQKTLERQQERLIDLFQEEQLDKAEYLRRKTRLDQERQIIEPRLQQLIRQADVEHVKEQMLGDFAEYCQQIEANLTNPTPELQQEVIRLLIDHVVVGEKEIVIKHIVPTDDDCRLLPGRKGSQRKKLLRFSFVPRLPPLGGRDLRG